MPYRLKQANGGGEKENVTDRVCYHRNPRHGLLNQDLRHRIERLSVKLEHGATRSSTLPLDPSSMPLEDGGGSFLEKQFLLCCYNNLVLFVQAAVVAAVQERRGDGGGHGINHNGRSSQTEREESGASELGRKGARREMCAAKHAPDTVAVAALLVIGSCATKLTFKVGEGSSGTSLELVTNVAIFEVEVKENTGKDWVALKESSAKTWTLKSEKLLKGPFSVCFLFKNSGYHVVDDIIPESFTVGSEYKSGINL
uniref:Expansin-like CBD domain-containing protein n=1 Tax=Oryza punctata TaxID=4537 RepID=A0A0E0LEC1_ORYPU